MVSCSMAHSIKLLGMRCSTWPVLLRPIDSTFFLRLVRRWFASFNSDDVVTGRNIGSRDRRKQSGGNVESVRSAVRSVNVLSLQYDGRPGVIDSYYVAEERQKTEIYYVQLQRETPAESIDHFSRFTCCALYWQQVSKQAQSHQHVRNTTVFTVPKESLYSIDVTHVQNALYFRRKVRTL